MLHYLVARLLSLLLGPEIPNLLTGSIFIETIFRIPGLSKFFVTSTFNQGFAPCTRLDRGRPGGKPANSSQLVNISTSSQSAIVSKVGPVLILFYSRLQTAVAEVYHDVPSSLGFKTAVLGRVFRFDAV